MRSSLQVSLRLDAFINAVFLWTKVTHFHNFRKGLSPHPKSYGFVSSCSSFLSLLVFVSCIYHQRTQHHILYILIRCTEWRMTHRLQCRGSLLIGSLRGNNQATTIDVQNGTHPKKEYKRMPWSPFCTPITIECSARLRPLRLSSKWRQTRLRLFSQDVIFPQHNKAGQHSTAARQMDFTLKLDSLV